MCGIIFYRAGVSIISQIAAEEFQRLLSR